MKNLKFFQNTFNNLAVKLSVPGHFPFFIDFNALLISVIVNRPSMALAFSGESFIQPLKF